MPPTAQLCKQGVVASSPIVSTMRSCRQASRRYGFSRVETSSRVSTIDRVAALPQEFSRDVTRLTSAFWFQVFQKSAWSEHPFLVHAAPISEDRRHPAAMQSLTS